MFIEFQNVSYQISNKKILQNISFSINKGEFAAILGANGSGKSTLAKLMNALLLPTDGKVLVKNLDTSDEKNLHKIRQTFGIVFQNPDNQIVATTVEDDIAFGPENLNIDGEEIEIRINNALKLTDLTDKRNFSTNMLSGGQKQKVAIASALAMNPEAIIFDEATSMLEPK
ncbi:MAG: ATP-binding cassette domain-containing protein [Selenomonadaceae bacterium]|nr:ATP-binding cassette domain-containing protein [Selenomonadaceae bacterium]